MVADITDSPRDACHGYPFHPTPDGEGLVGYLRTPDAYVEIVSYAKMLGDAKMRNAIFFRKLGLTDVDPGAPTPGEATGEEADLEQVE